MDCISILWKCLFVVLCFQDYKQQRPSQELVAKDLHGIEWKFRHIYRGYFNGVNLHECFSNPLN